MKVQINKFRMTRHRSFRMGGDGYGKLGKEGGAPPGAEEQNLDHLCLRVEPFDANPGT